MNLSKPLITALLLACTACDEPDQDASNADELAAGLRACVQAPSSPDVVDCARVLFADDAAPRCGEPLPPPKGCYYKANILVCPPKVTQDTQEDRTNNNSTATRRSTPGALTLYPESETTMNTPIRAIFTILAILITACDAEPQLDTPDVQRLAEELRACNHAPSDRDAVACALLTLADLDAPAQRCGTSPSPNPTPEPPPQCMQIGNKTICPPAGHPEPLTLDPTPDDRFAGAPETNRFIDDDFYMECSSRDGHTDCLCEYTCCRNQTQCACDDACPLPLPPSSPCGGGKPCPPFPHPTIP